MEKSGWVEKNFIALKWCVKVTKIYLDTFVFMDMLSGNRELIEKAEPYLKSNGQSVVSTILLTELAYHIRRRKGIEKTEEVLYYIQSLPNLTFIPVSSEIAALAGKLRAKYKRLPVKKLTYFDCIHIATAVLSGCSAFITGDKGFADIGEIVIEIY